MMRRAAACGVSGRPFLSGGDLLAELPDLASGVVIVELQNAGMDGFELIGQVVLTRFDCPIIAVLPTYDLKLAVACLRRGSADVIVRPDLAESLKEAIFKAQRVLEVRRPLFAEHKQDAAALTRLSSREREVLVGLASGAASKMIAERLHLSVRTVEAYRCSLVEKLDCGSAAGAIALVVRHNTFRHAHAPFEAGDYIQSSG
jgi:two-component system response regulator FixJ